MAGYALTRTSGLPSIVLIGGVAVIGLTPLVVLLGRLALPVWIVLSAALYPFVRFPAEDPVVTFDRLFLGALLVGLVLSYERTPRAREGVWLQRLFVGLAVIFLLSALASVHTSGNLAVWTDAFLLPFVVFLCAREAARDKRQLLSVAGAIALAGAVIATLGLAQRFAGLDLAPLLGSSSRFDTAINQVRISGPFSAPEPFALTLLSCLAGTLFWIRARGPAVLAPGLLFVGLELTAIFFTYFRAAWLGAVLILLIAFVADQRSWGRRFAAIAVAAIALVLASTIAAGNESVQTRLHDQQNVSGRVATWERGLELFDRHAVWGVGFQEFPEAVKELPEKGFEGVEALPQAHSSIVSTLAEQGIVGFAFLLGTAAAVAFVLRGLLSGARDPVDRTLAIDAAAAACAYLVMSATLTMIYYGPSNAMMALLVGLACGRLDLLRSST
jgi:O-antigen ligase